MDTQVVQQKQSLLEEAGFTKAAELVVAKTTLARKLALAYEHYRYVTQKQVDEFNRKIMAETNRPTRTGDLQYDSYGGYITHVADQLVFEAANKYKGMPPTDVLEAVKEAKTRGVFDGYLVASIQPVATAVKRPDPIVFGRVNGCDDYFYIAQWGNDVKLSDIISPSQG